MPTPPVAARRGSAAAALTFLLLLLLVAASPARAETNADTAVPPVCANPDYNYWVAHGTDYADDIVGSSRSDITLHVGFELGVGASLSCAFQSRPEPHQVCTEPGNCHAEYSYVPNATVTAFPDTIDAAGGDHQNVHISAPGSNSSNYDNTAAKVTWGSCFPGATYSPGWCDPALFKFEPGGFPVEGGQMLYRFRDETGRFSGQWTLSYGRLSPGFRLEHTAMAPCDRTMDACDYDVIFTRDPLNKPAVGRDAQVLLLLTGVHTGVYPNDAFPPAAVPLLVIQSAGGDASGRNGRPGAGGSGGAAGAPAVPTARQIGFAGRAPKLARLGASGLLSVTLPVKAAGVKVAGVLSVSARRARGLGLKVGRGRKALAIGAGSTTARRAGALTLALKLTRAAKAALAKAARRGSGIGSVKVVLTLTLSQGGVAARPVVKQLTLRR